ncbi:L-type lectin-domain containing receptor kinase IV.1-like [Quercus lobata]|uniref:non-specific serine/threonine protein kinase n=1 Tax=Quercus lobata TaxID=97700 RepID=A0A7N2KPY1_QUELO|nr:L-type lectin-domain containing receptor kinase IV.1-like [Quercus lobata]XP_030968581.1 L-type lectin-domain containing receptor kinase IV.1-like [Quercus lobata]
MFSKLVILLPLLISVVGSQDTNFIYNGFRSVNLSLDGIATITSNGLLELTNDTKQQKGLAFYSTPISFKNSLNDSAFSFSTTFVFAIVSAYPTLRGNGIAFVISPTRERPGALPNQYLGLFNETNNGNATNHLVAVELDTVLNQEFKDINGNHVGVDINGMVSENSSLAGYYADSGAFMNLTLFSGSPMQVWVEYDGVKKQLNVTLAPIDVGKPKIPLLSLSRDLSSIINKTMYVGFSSATGTFLTSHYILGWSFKLNGKAQELALSQLPKLPRGKERSKLLTIGLPVILVSLVLVAISGATYVIKRKRKFAELVEDWEVDYGPHRFKYKDLYIATKGFRDKELLGSGGFGKVYKGVLTTSKIEIAVKKVSHESRQGMREFVAEIVSIGRLRHRNLVPLLGYCRRKGELLLVYDYMSNGSLDKYLFDQPQVTLSWSQRFKVIKDVASGLFYLHEGWDQVVIHRDVKASNVLLDGELNGKLGDFGLARLYDHGTDPQTTHVVGTLGYLAPEHTQSGKATTSTDVFAFGAFMLEVACGRRPIQANGPPEDSILVDWVFSHFSRGEIMEARDPNYGTSYVAEELELVLKLGLMCSHSEAAARPSMRQVVQYIEGDVPFPDFSSLGLCSTGLTFAHGDGFDDFFMSYPSSTNQAFSYTSSIAESLLSGGR